MSYEIKDLKREIIRLKQSVKNQRFGLVWMDVPEAFEDDVENKLPILREIREYSINNDDNKPTHIVIEGDNYHALTCLNYSHRNKVDFIYIDPPYNTGNDGFRYKDKRILDKYPDGTEVPTDHPFRHSYWLSFMKKRLELAYNLLADDGVMFISIDDNELANLLLLCVDITKKESNVELIIWDKVTGNALAGSGKMKITHRFRRDHEYIIVVYKNKDITYFNKPIEKYVTKNIYGNRDNDERGDWISSEICKSEAKSNPNGKNYYSVTLPSGRVLTRQWHIDEDEFRMLDDDNRIYWGGGNIIPRLKKFVDEGKPTTPVSVFYGRGSTTDGNKEAKQLGIDFDNPKPLSLISYLLEIASDQDSIVLDFFAGSGTTGHAVMDINEKLGGQRQYILITNNENNIMYDACYPRLKKVIEGYEYNGERSQIIYEKVLSIDDFEDPTRIWNKVSEIKIANENENNWDDYENRISHGTLQVLGIKKVNGKIEGLGSSLNFYQTDFVGKNSILDFTDADKIDLSRNAGSLLSIAENTLIKVYENSYYQLFTNKNRERYTAVYFREEIDEFEGFVSLVKDQEKAVSVYIFSWGNEQYIGDFDNLSNIKIKNIPQPILEIYKQIYNL